MKLGWDRTKRARVEQSGEIKDGVQRRELRLSRMRESQNEVEQRKQGLSRAERSRMKKNGESKDGVEQRDLG